MSGRRQGNFRSGDRSEYLAQYALSRVSFVNPAPRQEDFGIADFLCVLAKRESDQCVYPGEAFYLQVKSDEKDLVLDEHQVRWVYGHMALPLFLCCVDKGESRVAIYSTWNMWRGLFEFSSPQSVTLQLSGAQPLPHPRIDRDARTILVELGPPALSATIDDFERDPDRLHDVLAMWSRMDRLNITAKDSGAVVASGPRSWETNGPFGDYMDRSYLFGPNHGRAEHAITPVLIALAHNYHHFRHREKFDAVLGLLREYERHLDPRGLEFIRGQIPFPEMLGDATDESAR